MSQKKKVLDLMRKQGYVSRNWALQNYISRLSAIMLDLKKEGINFETKDKDGDYIYYLKDRPKEIIEYRVKGELVGKKVIW